MKLIKWGLFLLSFLVCWWSWGQKVEVPKGYVFEKPEDYAQYTQDVEACVEWMVKTPVSANPVKRGQMMAFLLKWLSGTPSVKLEMDANSQPIMSDMDFKYAHDLVVAYLGGMALHQIKHPDEPDYTKVIQSGIETVLKMTSKQPAAFKDSKAVIIYRELKEKGTMTKWIDSNLQKRFANY